MNDDEAFSLTIEHRTPHRRTTDHTRDDWRTPPDLYDNLCRRFTFTGDACASDQNHLAERYFTAEDDALSSNWSKLGQFVFMNPPYSEVSRFISRARRAVEDGEVRCVVSLVPSTPDVSWFHKDALTSASELWFMRGRISFIDPVSLSPVPGNPVGSCVIVWSEGGGGWAGPRVGSLCSKTFMPLGSHDIAYWDSMMRGRKKQMDLF